MKKILILLVAMALVPGFAMAQGLGLTAGLEFGVEKVNEPDEQPMDPFVIPSIAYDTTLMDGALAVGANLSFKMAFADGYMDDKGEDAIYMGLGFGAYGKYTLGIGADGKLTLGLLTDIDRLVFNGMGSEDLLWANSVDPYVRYGHTLAGIGELYGELQVPIIYLQGTTDTSEIQIVMDGFKIGWNSEFGLGLWVKEQMYLYDGADVIDAGHKEIDFLVSYTFAPMAAEVEVNIPKDFDTFGGGITVAPKFSYTDIIPGLSAWVKCGIKQIALEDADIRIDPSLGVTFKF